MTKWENHQNSELELFRKKVIELTSSIELLKRQLAEETKEKYKLLQRIKELTSDD